MSKDLERAKELFLNDVDEETRQENEERIAQWEHDLRHNEAFLDWRAHDITGLIVVQLKEAYRDTYKVLAENRILTAEQRAALWAKQDAAVWLLSLIDADAAGEIKSIQAEIRRAIQAA